jgi:Tol biopolymer transport system component
MLGAIAAPDPNELFDPTLSPDGRRVAVARTVENIQHVWLIDALRVNRLTDGGKDGSPIWSPDGKRVIFDSNRNGTIDLYERGLNAESDDLLIHSSETKIPDSFTQDGRFLLYTSTSPSAGGVGTNADIMVLPMDGKSKPQPFINSRFDERYGQFSPDGRWVAYQSNESGDGEYQIYVKSFPAPGERLPISSAGGIQPRWRPDGKELYYVAPDGSLMAVPIAGSGTKLTPGTPVRLFQPRIYGGGNAANFYLQQYDVSKDGRFLVNISVGEAVATPITLILNWTGKGR